MANDTSIGIQDRRTRSATAAAPADSMPPATLAAMIQPRVMGAWILRQPDHRSHARHGPIPAPRVKARGIAMRAVGAAANLRDAVRGEAPARDRAQIELPVPGARRLERVFGRRIARDEGGAHFGADFV